MIDSVGHLGIFNPHTFTFPVHIIGCGGMGSRIAESLVRMGVGMNASPIHLHDGDKFAGHNLANQWMSFADIGSYKAKSIRRHMLRINHDCKVTAHNIFIADFVKMEGVVFVCVDSMTARRTIMENVVEQNPKIVCVIETRMDAEVGISHCFNPHNKIQSDCWWLYWHDDDEADNIAGCNGPQSIVSAILGTSMLALKQFEQFARAGHTKDLASRVYMDFDSWQVKSEHWPS